MSRLKIVIVGGGSNAWAPQLVRDMLLKPELAGSEFVLYDVNRKAAELVKALCDRLVEMFGVKARIAVTDQRARAFRGADYFVITISTGGLDAMAHDLAIPQRYSIFHTVGDTSGPGGWARAIRNFDAFSSLAGDINRHAPGAVVLNYSNPMTVLTDLLARTCRGPVVGLCHGLFENLAFLARLYGIEREEDLAVHYAGLNHFFWITRCRAGDVDVIADLGRRIGRDISRGRGAAEGKGTGQSFTDLLREAHAEDGGFDGHREVATELFRLTGVMPYLGDRHTSEFFPWYVTSAANLKKYRIVRTSIADRRAAWRKRDRRLRRMARGQIDEPFTRPGRETAANIIGAHATNRPFIDVGNLPNSGQVANLPPGVVVETPVRVDGSGVAPIAFGPLPEPIVGFVEPYARVFNLTLEACLRRDRRMALAALRLDPLCSHLNTEQVNAMGEKLLAAHREFISVF